MLRILCWLTLALACVLPVTVAAQERVTLGFGRSFSNDTLGDGSDRWRTGAYGVSWVRGPQWTGALPESFGEVVEVRGRIDLITPENLQTPKANDRRLAAALTFGLHTHWGRGNWDMRAGADLVFTGPQTSIAEGQRSLHERLGVVEPSEAVLDDQIPNGLHPTLSFEAARTFKVGKSVRIRPFVEAQGGVETLVRVGTDVILGGFGTEGLLIRDTATGTLYEGIKGQSNGLSLVVGGDVAHVEHSVFLPTGGAAVLDPTRIRSRLGVHWQKGATSVFYGASYLHQEFEWQRYGQTLGTVRLSILF